MKKLKIDKKNIEKLYWGKNYSLGKCGNFFGVSDHTVMDKMVKLGIPRRNKNEANKIDIKEEKLKKLYNDKKLSMKECGEYLGVSMVTIRRRLVEFGIVRRKNSEGRIPWNKKEIIDKWIQKEQAKHIICQCGCGEEIIIKKDYYWAGIPKFKYGHYSRTIGIHKVKIKCSGCNNIIENYPSLIYRRNNRVWCPECMKKGLYAKKGEESPNWKGGKRVSRERQKQDIRFILNNRMRADISGYLKRRGSYKQGRKWEKLVDYDSKELKKRLTKTMPEGYTWQDFLSGELHIDHIIPVLVFNFSKTEHADFKRCWALSNLRLLPAKENLIKGAKLDRPFQPALKI
ncbi:hypothetical protein ES695_16320 [Candidatus Atribacteria bacterium 1244-E10-H5-B2]|nr:MAG: hypothetical protein ES695_16320 [Candidatus Atribacteria bacterium 1244-E10-H5-B2]